MSSGEYVTSKTLPPYLGAYIILKGMIIPRSLIAAVFATTTMITYTLLAKPPLSLIILLTVLITPYWLETIYYRKILRQIISINHD